MKKLLVVFVTLVCWGLFSPSVNQARDMNVFYENDEEKRAVLYEHPQGIEDLSAGNFIGAAQRGLEERGPKDCETVRVGGGTIYLHGKRLDEKNYVWILMENGRIIDILLFTKKK